MLEFNILSEAMTVKVLGIHLFNQNLWGTDHTWALYYRQSHDESGKVLVLMGFTLERWKHK